MIVGDERAYVRFDFQEILPAHLANASISCSVEALCGDFKGRVKSVWFAREDTERFLSDFRDLEEKRRGTATLRNMSSPSMFNPLSFDVYSTDDVGHFAVSVELTETSYAGDVLRPLKLSLSFPIDAGNLISLLVEFRKIFGFREGRI
jgi:hypothetical protein